MPGNGTTLRLQPTRHAPGLARRAVREAGVGLRPETQQAAIIVISELVTNAVVRGAGMVTVAIERRVGAVAIAVNEPARPDGCSPTPPIPTAVAGSSSSRGSPASGSGQHVFAQPRGHLASSRVEFESSNLSGGLVGPLGPSSHCRRGLRR